MAMGFDCELTHLIIGVMRRSTGIYPQSLGRYSRSKLGAILLAKQLAKRKLQPENKVIAISVHPGTISTDQQEGYEEEYGL